MARLLAATTAAPQMDATAALLCALKARLGGDVLVEKVSSQAWASATFRGARHTIVLSLSDWTAAELRAALNDDLQLIDHLLCDLSVGAFAAAAHGKHVAVIDALTVEDFIRPMLPAASDVCPPASRHPAAVVEADRSQPTMETIG